MEKNDAIEFCKVHYINYLGLVEGLLYTDFCAQVAVLLYSAFKANSHSTKIGRVYYACQKSGCFQDMTISRFREVWTIVFPQEAPSLSTFKRSIEAVSTAFIANKTPCDRDQYIIDRKMAINLSNAIKNACGREKSASTAQNEP